MHILPFLYPTLISLLLLDPASAAGKKAKNPKDAVLLSNVKSLTLRADKKTSHRRVPAVPQLVCQGPGCKHHTVEIMRCTNQGSDYSSEDIQWSCAANLPEEFKLGSTEVICEGYESADDEKVLKGSCGVEYRLLLTDKGEERYGTNWWGSKSKPPVAGKIPEEDGWTWGSVLFVVIFIAIAVWIVASACAGANGAQRQPRRPGGGHGGWGGGGGGGGGDGWDDPPPPYPGKRYSSNAQEGWRPGFWTGAATGAAAGYMAGNRGQRQEPPARRDRGWFGGGDSGSGSWGAGPSRSSGSGSSSGSSARHESTGFGSTTRR